MQEKLYFIRKYDLDFVFHDIIQIVDSNRTNYISTATYDGNKTIQIQIGLKELNTYLILFQGVFSFLNEISWMRAEIDPKLKEYLKIEKEKYDLLYNNQKNRD